MMGYARPNDIPKGLASHVKVMVRKSPIVHDTENCDCLIPCSLPSISCVDEDGHTWGVYVREYSD